LLVSRKAKGIYTPGSYSLSLSLYLSIYLSFSFSFSFSFSTYLSTAFSPPPPPPSLAPPSRSDVLVSTVQVNEELYVCGQIDETFVEGIKVREDQQSDPHNNVMPTQTCRSSRARNHARARQSRHNHLARGIRLCLFAEYFCRANLCHGVFVLMPFLAGPETLHTAFC
jgi:hypothetical protein